MMTTTMMTMLLLLLLMIIDDDDDDDKDVMTVQINVSLTTAMQELVQRLSHLAVDFESELMRWTNDQYYASHVHKIQLPFNQVLYCA